MSLTITRQSGEAITFDVYENVTVPGSATYTVYPIEEKREGSDNVKREVPMLAFTVRQMEYPKPGAEDPEGIYGPERILRAWQFLEEVGTTGELVTVEAPRMGVYEDFILHEWPMTFGRTLWAGFDIAMHKLISGAVEVVSVTPISAIDPDARAGFQGSEDVGEQATQESEEGEVPEGETPPSFLFSLFGGR